MSMWALIRVGRVRDRRRWKELWEKDACQGPKSLSPHISELTPCLETGEVSRAKWTSPRTDPFKPS